MRDKGAYNPHPVSPDMKCEYPGCSHEKEDVHYRFCKECWWNQDPRNIKNGGTVDLEKHNMSDLRKDRPQALPNKFIVETYKEDRGLKATVTNGFAMVAQKIQVKGLKLLADAFVNIGVTTIHYPIGATVYIKEGALQSQPWAKAAFTSDAIEGEFMIVDQAHIEFVVNP